MEANRKQALVYFTVALELMIIFIATIDSKPFIESFILGHVSFTVFGIFIYLMYKAIKKLD